MGTKWGEKRSRVLNLSEKEPQLNASEVARRVGCSYQYAAGVLRSSGVKRVSKRELILDEFAKDPDRSTREIADVCGAHVSYVQSIAQKECISLPRVAHDRRVSIVPDDLDYTWLSNEAAQMNVSISEVVAAIVTDARCDAMDAQS